MVPRTAYPTHESGNTISRSGLNIDLDLLIEEPEGEYHAQRKTYLSSHQLGDFRKCPQLYQRKINGQIRDEDSPAYLLGRAAHVRILEGAVAYHARFATGGPINPKTGKPFGQDTQAFRSWVESEGKPALTQEQADLVELMASGVGGNTKAVDLLLEGKAEGVVRTEYYGVACQIRLDWVNSHQGIVDLKTCDDLTWFEADARRYGYAHQMAFYRAVLAVFLGLKPLDIPVHLLAIEKKEPFRAGVWRLGEDVLGIAQKENEEAIKRLKQCRASGIWPTGYEEIRTFDWL